jgi:hypothetical protein
MTKTGEQLRDEAINQVEDNANAAWLEEAVNAIAYLSEVEDYITADSVWDLVGSPREPRAMGAAFRIAKKQKLIAPTDTYKKSNRPQRHAGPMRVWATA